MEGIEVAWQNKDIFSKYFADLLKGKSLAPYGLDIPEVEALLPTNLPMIQANELRADNVFLLRDQSIAIIDYESGYSEDDKQTYIDYVNRIGQRYRREWKREVVIRMIVIYTADITREQVRTEFDLGCLKLHVETAFLSELPSAEIRERLNRKILSGEKLTDEEMMEFIILPMSYRGRQAKNTAIRENMDLMEKIPDDRERMFLLSGMAVIANKVIDEDILDRIRRMISMTRLAQMFEDEKQEAVQRAVEQAVAETTARIEKETAARVEREATAQAEKRMAKRLLSNGISPEDVLRCSTYLSMWDIQNLAAETARN